MQRALQVDLDNADIAILKSLMEDGRKSFRAISREIKVSTPTLKSRYERLVNIGLPSQSNQRLIYPKSLEGRKKASSLEEEEEEKLSSS